jgi:hypothetical protein
VVGAICGVDRPTDVAARPAPTTEPDTGTSITDSVGGTGTSITDSIGGTGSGTDGCRKAERHNQ